jgi:hypothetical protein
MTDASINYFFRPQPDTGKSVKADSATIKIYNDAGENIRTFKTKADTGFQQGILGIPNQRHPAIHNNPNHAPMHPNKVVAIPAEPGIYKAVVTVGKWSDSTQLNVQS